MDLELGGVWKRLGGFVEEGLHPRRCAAVLDGDKGEKLDGRLRVVGLEEDQGGYEECRQDGGEETGLFKVSFEAHG